MALQMRLANHYVELDQEEMMYMDGGGLATVRCSKAFIIDVVTAGSSFLLVAINTAMEALGWILGGSVARTHVTQNSYTLFNADIPLVGRTSIYLS